MGQDVLYGLSLLLYCRELLGDVFDSVTEQASLGDGSVKKAYLVNISHLSQVEPEVALLGHQSGHHLLEGQRRDFRCPEGEVSCCAQLLNQPCVGTILVTMF